MKSQDPESNADQAARSLEDVRKRLESYGYLNGRIERFYLSSLSRSASQLLTRLFLSFRVGILTGTLSAILMAVGTVLFNRDLLQRGWDLALVFLYFEVFFVFLFSALEFLLIYLVGASPGVAGPRRLVAAGQAISFLVGLSFFAYFLYWGRVQSATLHLFGPVSLFAIIVILLLSCIFVAKCTWLGFLVAFRESEIGRLSPNWRRYGIEVLLSLAAILIMLPLAFHGRREEGGGPPLAVFSTPDRWMVVGIDGASLELSRKLASAGDLPYLQSVLDRGFVAQLTDDDPVIPPVTWTTIATGVTPAEHGILMPEARRWAGLRSWVQVTPLELAMHSIFAQAGLGQRQPVSGYMRRAKAFWEILSDSGMPVGVVNWWGSWPAHPMRGWNVSERYYYKLVSRGQPQNDTYPPDLFARYKGYASAGGAAIEGAAIDQFYGRIFREQMKTSPVRVGAVYLPGLDILNYQFYQQDKLDPFSYTEAYRAHFQQIDRMIESLVSENPGYELLVILHKGRSLTAQHSAIALVAENHRLPAAGARQFPDRAITPLLLDSCGIPIGRSMPAQLATLLTGTPPRTVPSYARAEEPVESAHADQFNDLLVEQLRSLGYLQ